MHLWTDQYKYPAGQIVTIHGYAKNHSRTSCRMPYDSCASAISISDGSGAEVYNENPPSVGRLCYSKPQLLPAGEVTGAWGLGWSPGNASPGVYTVRMHWLVDQTASFAITSP